MESLSKSLEQFVALHGTERTYWIAYSGGLDSQVLLHALAALRQHYPLTLQAVYVNHGVSPHAEAWGQHCQRSCAELHVPFSQYALGLDATSSEEVLRNHRYQLFAGLLAPQDVLFTAHHQNDQAETLLVQLLRGAGPKGLAAMPQIKPFSVGFHARPFLGFSRAQLQQYAEHFALQWIEDESNSNTQYTRNFLRHAILPLLQSRWPSVTETLARVATHCAEMQEIVQSVAASDLALVQGSKPHLLSIQKLLALDMPRQRQVVRLWLQQQHFPLPSAIKMQHILQDMLHARQDKTPEVSWQHVTLYRYRDDLYAMDRLAPHDRSQIISWDCATPLALGVLGELRPCKMRGGLSRTVRDVTVRFRQGGETIRLPGRGCAHALKKLFQEAGVPRWMRDRVPLIFVGEVLAVVVGYWIAEGFVAKDDGIGFEWGHFT